MLRFVTRLPMAVVTAASVAGAVAAGKGLDIVVESLTPRESPWSIDRGTLARGGAILGAVTLAGSLAVRFWRKKQKILIDKPFLQESVVPDSEEMPTRPPSCQVWLAYPNADGNLEVVGSGFRTQFAGRSFLMTAGHNLAFDDQLFLIKGPNVVRIGTPNVISIGTDAALMEVPEKYWSTMGVGVASFSPVPTKGQIHVSVCGRDQKGTTGYLTGAPCVGQVTYSGTTKGGYSGAPYFSANNVFGMHCHGGRRNGGISAMYLSALAKLHLGLQEESDYSFTWYKRMYNKSREAPSVQFLNDKAVVMNDDGHVYVIDKSRFEDFTSRMAIDAGREEYEGLEEGLEEESARDLNSQGPANTRASNTMAVSLGQEELLTELKSINESNAHLKKVLMSRMNELDRGFKKFQNSLPQTPPQQPLDAPSTSTQKGGKKQ